MAEDLRRLHLRNHRGPGETRRMGCHHGAHQYRLRSRPRSDAQLLALPGISKPVRAAHLMNGGAEVNHAIAEGSVVLELPKRAPNEIDQVIVLELGS